MNKQVAQAVAMPFPWQVSQWQQLALQIDQQRLPHAVMLAGPEHIGKYQFALSLAQRLLCEAPVAGYACGLCKSCQLVTAKSHPDLVNLVPEERGKAIKVDAIREFSNFTSKTSQQGGWKVSIICPAEAMNVNASNALLKSLEEPGPNTLIILVCHEPSRMIATIRSRCRLITFPVPAIAEVRPWLSQVSGKQEGLDELIDYADGCPLLTLQLLETDLLDRRRQFDGLIDDLSAQRTSALKVAEFCQHNDSVMMVDWLYTRLATMVRSGQSDISTRLIFRYMDRLLQAKRQMQSAANPNLLLLWEELLLNWQQLFMRKRA